MMSDKNILNIGKWVFIFSFLGGSILFFSLFSGIMTEFAVFKGLILCVFILINAIVFFSLITYGVLYQSKLKICLKSASMLLINIPVSFIYGCLIDY
jgi:LIVCS family branched-chain amino acid:cation transporter